MLIPYLGLSLQDNLPLDVINALGLKSTTAYMWQQWCPGGPADKAGLKAGTVATSYRALNSGGDLIIAVDGQPVQVSNDLMRYLILNKSPGDTITLTMLRGRPEGGYQADAGHTAVVLSRHLLTPVPSPKGRGRIIEKS